MFLLQWRPRFQQESKCDQLEVSLHTLWRHDVCIIVLLFGSRFRVREEKKEEESDRKRGERWLLVNLKATCSRGRL